MIQFAQCPDIWGSVFLNYNFKKKYHQFKMLPFKCQPYKMVKHIQTIRRKKPTNCLSVFDHFVGLALKGLITSFLYFLSLTNKKQTITLHEYDYVVARTFNRERHKHYY